MNNAGPFWDNFVRINVASEFGHPWFQGVNINSIVVILSLGVSIKIPSDKTAYSRLGF
jgi:hypothetical protein